MKKLRLFGKLKAFQEKKKKTCGSKIINKSGGSISRIIDEHLNSIISVIL